MFFLLQLFIHYIEIYKKTIEEMKFFWKTTVYGKLKLSKCY